MPYTLVDPSFWTNPKRFRLCKLLNNPYAGEVAIRLWAYAAEHSHGGDMSHITFEEFSAGTGLSATEIDALVDAGFLERDPLAVHDFNDHTGRYERATEKGRQRQAKYRQRLKKKGVTSHRNVTGDGALSRGCDVGSEVKRSEVDHDLRISDDLADSQSGGSVTRSSKKPKTAAPKTGAGCVPSESFDAFWKAYPRKVGKRAAMKAWEKAGGDSILPAALAALSWQVKSEQWTRDGGTYVPHPSTYLNQGRWDDEPAVRPGANGNGSRPDHPRWGFFGFDRAGLKVVYKTEWAPEARLYRPNEGDHPPPLEEQHPPIPEHDAYRDHDRLMYRQFQSERWRKVKLKWQEVDGKRTVVPMEPGDDAWWYVDPETGEKFTPTGEVIA